MPEEIEVRRAELRDLADIARIYNDAILTTTATFDTEPKSLEDRTIWFNRHTREYPLLVGLIEDRVVGWASLRPYGERKAFRYTVENAVYVDSEHQGRGVGTALLGELLHLADELGYHAVIALVVGGNASSEALHRRFGFEDVGVMHEVGWKFDRWLDLAVMEKIL